MAHLPGVQLLECSTTTDPRSVLAAQFQGR